MPVWALLLAAAFTIRQDGAELRSDCDPSEPVIARLSLGTPAIVRFGLNGCYAVEVTHAGQILTGFLPAESIAGIEKWEQERRAASGVQTPAASTVAASPDAAVPLTLTSPSAAAAIQLINANQPNEALELLEKALAAAPKDAQLLALAGVASLKTDSAVQAIGYFKDSLGVKADPGVQQLLDRAQRELASDQGALTLIGSRVVLRYDPEVMPTVAARLLLPVLEQEHSRISFALGCRNAERISATAQSREAYRQATGAAEWSGGQFDGRIRVALVEPDPNGPYTRKVFAHELVHACLAAMGPWPSWFHEGLAQKLTNETLSDARRAEIKALAKAGQIPPLGQLSQSWTGLSSANAELAYATALYAMELFYEHHKEYGIRNLLKNPDQLPRITASLDQLMRQ